ncbi:MAG: transposase [Oscillospiraceae bacterium]
MKKYSEELKSKVIKLHLQEGRTQASLEQEFNLGRGSIYYWLKSYNKECLTNTSKAQEKQEFEDYLKLKKEVEELEKENLFLKKAAAFFAKEI